MTSFLERRELALRVDVLLDVDRLATLGELADLLESVVLLDVLAAAGDRQEVQELEIVEIHRRQQ